MAQATAQPANYQRRMQMMTDGHRDFFEQIVTELNGVVPICNQGKCSAAEISETQTEQQQITDLMNQVEQFCGELRRSTYDLFEKYYNEKDRFYGDLYCTTAAIKSNLLEQTLVDRAADVRWWANENELTDAMHRLAQTSNQLDSEFEDLTNYLEAAVVAVRIPTLESNWKTQDFSEAVEELVAYLPRKRELMFNRLFQDEFRGKAEALCERLQVGSGAEQAIKFTKKVLKKLRGCQDQVDRLCRQLERIRAAYPSFHDLVVTDHQGVVIANANPKRRDLMLAERLDGDRWWQEIVQSGGSAPSVHVLDEGPISQGAALAFSVGIRPREQRSSELLGGLAGFCDFQSEVQQMLEDYMPRDERGSIQDGWYSFFTDERGSIICSSDAAMLWPGSQSDLPRRQYRLEPGESTWSHSIFKGQPCVVFSYRREQAVQAGCAAWVSHVVAPVSSIFHAEERKSPLELSSKEMIRSKLVPQINKDTYRKLQKDRQAIKLISLNGILFASQLGKRGVSLAPVFEKITATGDFATCQMETMLREMANAEIDLNLRCLETFSKQAMDMMSRRILERSKSVQLWSRTGEFRRFLTSELSEEEVGPDRLLKAIHDDFPAFRNIVLVASSGEIVAASRPQRFPDGTPPSATDQPWLAQSRRGNAPGEVHLHAADVSLFDTHESSAIVYACGITTHEESREDAGSLACFYSWKAAAREVLVSCLPRDEEGRPLQDSFAVFCDRDQRVIQSSDERLMAIGEVLSLPSELRSLESGRSGSGIFEWEGRRFIVGSTKGSGDTLFNRLGWSTHVARPLC